MSTVLSAAFTLNVCAARMEYPTNSSEGYSVSINTEDLDVNDRITFEEAVSLKASHENISGGYKVKKLVTCVLAGALVLTMVSSAFANGARI